MEIGDDPVEQEVTLDERLEFISKQDVGAQDTTTPAYTVDGPDGYAIFVDSGTPIAPEFRDSNGDKLDSSTRVTVQKCDKQGNPLGGGVVFTELLGKMRFDKFRNDPEFFRKTQRSLMVDEREIVKVFVDVPAGEPGFDAANSRLTVGDDTSDFGKSVEIVDHDDLSGKESQAVKAASQASGRGA